MLSRQEKYHKKVIKDIWYMNQVLFFLLKFIGAMANVFQIICSRKGFMLELEYVF